MDTNVVPDVLSWEFKVDSVIRAVQSQVWASSTTLAVTLVNGAIPLVDVTVRLTMEDEDLHQLGGSSVLPFGPETIPEQ